VTSGGAALAQRCQVPRPGGSAGFIMIKNKSYKRQASSVKEIQPEVVWITLRKI